MINIMYAVDPIKRIVKPMSGHAVTEQDHEASSLRFAFPDSIDPTAEGTIVRVMYIRPDGGDPVAKTLTFYKHSGGYYLYDWTLQKSDLQECGCLVFSLCVLTVSEGVVSEEWHTAPYSLDVLHSIHTDDSDEGDETITPTVAQRVAVLETMIQRVASGAPIVVASTSAMTDTSQIYVLSTDGNWYYHNGSAWVAGGEYGAVSTDTTLTQSGIPADGKTVGDAINAVTSDVAEVQDALERLDVETDKTLSIEGKPADSKTAGEAIRGLRTELNGITEEINLFDSNAVTTGYYLDADGIKRAYTGSGYTDFIPVTTGEYTISFDIATAPQNYNLRVHGYDNGKGWVRQIFASEIAAETSSVNETFEVPTGIAYIRISLYLYNLISNCAISDGKKIAVDSIARQSISGQSDDIAKIQKIEQKIKQVEHTINKISNPNIFDGTVILGGYISGDGSVKSYADAAYTNLISVEEGVYTVSFDKVSTTNDRGWYARIFGYNSAEEFVSVLQSKIVEDDYIGEVLLSASVSDAIAYIRVSIYEYTSIENFFVGSGTYGYTAIDKIARDGVGTGASPTPKRISALKSWGAQPAADGTSGSFCDMTKGYEQLLSDVYEPLRLANPTYITRENLGKDASGTYDMYVYTFEPRYYQQSIILVAGIHADEPDAIACLARIMQMICNEYDQDEDLKFIRQNIKITVVPVVNVWGFSQSSKKSRTNANGGILQQWDASTPIAEIANLRPYIIGLKEEVSFLLDMHTTTNNNYLDFYGIINKHDKNVRTIFRTNAWLCEQYALDGRTVDDQYLGYYEVRPGIMSYYFFSTHGMTTATLELSDFRWDSHKSTAPVITMGVTMWMNYIMQQINDFYKTMSDIPEGDYRESRP